MRDRSRCTTDEAVHAFSASYAYQSQIRSIINLDNMQDKQNPSKSIVLFFAYIKYQGIIEHMCNMVLAIAPYTDLVVVYDKKLEFTQNNLNRFKANNIQYFDISELSEVISTRFNNKPLLFHCNGFSHLRIAKKVRRPGDKIMLSVHCFRNAQRKGKWGVAPLTYLLYFRSVDLWHFMSTKNREEYFWFRIFPSCSCVFPLGVEELFMTRPTKRYEVRDLSGKIIADISNKVNIVCIARFKSWKRHKYLLRSLCPILRDNTYLYLLGHGPILRDVMDMAEEMGIRNNVIFTGNVDRHMVHYLLDNASIAVTVSTSETFGWSLLESFCMDVPIVTTNVGIASSIIQDYHNGFILHPDCKKEEFMEKTILGLKLFNKVDNSGIKQKYLWDNYGKTAARCYDSLMQYRDNA